MRRTRGRATREWTALRPTLSTLGAAYSGKSWLFWKEPGDFSGCFVAYVDCSDELWREISRVIGDEGLELYDLERPTSGSLRVTLSRRSAAAGVPQQVTASGSEEEVEAGEVESDEADSDEAELGDSEGARGGVTSGDCSRICRKLMNYCESEGNRLGLGSEPEIDVSSPGLDRTLRLPRHFEQAVGKVIRCIPKGDKPWMEVGGKPLVGVLRGVLEGFDSGRAHVREERTKAVVIAPLEAIKRANVEFMPEGSAGPKSGAGRRAV